PQLEQVGAELDAGRRLRQYLVLDVRGPFRARHQLRVVLVHATDVRPPGAAKVARRLPCCVASRTSSRGCSASSGGDDPPEPPPPPPPHYATSHRPRHAP